MSLSFGDVAQMVERLFSKPLMVLTTRGTGSMPSFQKKYNKVVLSYYIYTQNNPLIRFLC